MPLGPVYYSQNWQFCHYKILFSFDQESSVLVKYAALTWAIALRKPACPTGLHLCCLFAGFFGLDFCFLQWLANWNGFEFLFPMARQHWNEFFWFTQTSFFVHQNNSFQCWLSIGNKNSHPFQFARHCKKQKSRPKKPANSHINGPVGRACFLSCYNPRNGSIFDQKWSFVW